MSTSVKVLLIEDNPADVAIIQAYFQEAGFRHVFCHSDSLADGLAVLQEQKADLVLLDLNLLDVEGFKTLQQFRVQAPEVPVIVLTGFKNEIMGVQAVREGAQDFLVKGNFDSRTLVRSIRHALQRFETEAKLREKAKTLSELERNNRIAHQIARFGGWEMDIVDNIMKWEDEIFRFFGFLPNSFSPSLAEYLKYVHVEDRNTVEHFFEEAMQDGLAHSLQHRIVIGNTKVKVVQVNAQLHFLEKENKIVLLGSVQDMTQQIQDKASKAESDNTGPSLPAAAGQGEVVADLEEETAAEPSRALEPLFSDTAFHVRTPLASVANFLYLLEDTELNQQQKTYLAGIKASLDSLSLSLNNWFNGSLLRDGQEEVRLSEIPLKDTIRTIYNIASIRMGKGEQELTLDLSQKLPDRIRCDQQKLSQLVYNLLDTGLSYGLSGKPIQFTVGVLGSRSEDGLSLLLRVQFEANDFSANRATALLKDEKVLTGKGLEAGKHLSWVVAGQLAEIMGGKLEAFQKTKRKLILRAELPIELGEAAVASPKKHPESEISILLVEDHDLHRLATKRMLSNWSKWVSVDVAESGAEGLEMALNRDYDIILMDLEMPQMNGIEAAIKIKNARNTPIIALTANGSKQEQERCARIGIDDYLVKPVHPDILFEHLMKQL